MIETQFKNEEKKLKLENQLHSSSWLNSNSSNSNSNTIFTLDVGEF